MSRGRAITRILLAVFYGFAGYMHLALPEPFVAITPDFVPWKQAIVFWTGCAEIFGALALIQPFSAGLVRAGGIGLALYALCVFPANINHFAMDLGRADHGLGLAYHVPRMVAQPLLIWLTLWAANIAVPWSRNSHGS